MELLSKVALGLARFLVALSHHPPTHQLCDGVSCDSPSSGAVGLAKRAAIVVQEGTRGFASLLECFAVLVGFLFAVSCVPFASPSNSGETDALSLSPHGYQEHLCVRGGCGGGCGCGGVCGCVLVWVWVWVGVGVRERVRERKTNIDTTLCQVIEVTSLFTLWANNNITCVAYWGVIRL